MSGPNISSISSSISMMLHENESAITGAINQKTSIKAWMFVAVAIVAVVFLVKKMGR